MIIIGLPINLLQKTTETREKIDQVCENMKFILEITVSVRGSF